MPRFELQLVEDALEKFRNQCRRQAPIGKVQGLIRKIQVDCMEGKIDLSAKGVVLPAAVAVRALRDRGSPDEMDVDAVSAQIQDAQVYHDQRDVKPSGGSTGYIVLISLFFVGQIPKAKRFGKPTALDVVDLNVCSLPYNASI